MASSPGTSAVGDIRPSESRPSALLRGMVLDPDEPLDDLRGDDDRADRHVPARPVHRPRHVGALVEQPRPEGAAGSRLLPERPDGAAGTSRSPEAAAGPAREAGEFRLEGGGRGADEEAVPEALHDQAALQPAARLVHRRTDQGRVYA